MKLKFIYLFVLAFFCSKIFCQNKVSAEEYKVYNAVLKAVFVQRGFDLEHLPKEHTILNINEVTVNRLLGTMKTDYVDTLSDTFYKSFEKLNEQKHTLNAKKITVKVNSKFKKFDVDFSMCYINKEYAIVYMGIVFAPLNGEGAVYVLKYSKASKAWEIVKKVRKWVS